MKVIFTTAIAALFGLLFSASISNAANRDCLRADVSCYSKGGHFAGGASAGTFTRSVAAENPGNPGHGNGHGHHGNGHGHGHHGHHGNGHGWGNHGRDRGKHHGHGRGNGNHGKGPNK